MRGQPSDTVCDVARPERERADVAGRTPGFAAPIRGYTTDRSLRWVTAYLAPPGRRTSSLGPLYDVAGGASVRCFQAGLNRVDRGGTSGWRAGADGRRYDHS